MITIEQIRAARTMLHLTQKELATNAGISVATLNNIERGVQHAPKKRTMACIAKSLEDRGIIFINEASGHVGVCLRPASAKNATPRILIVDDCKADRLLYSSWLKQMPEIAFDIDQAYNVQTGLQAYEKEHADCIILDFRMPDSNGLEMLEALKKRFDVMPPIIFVTGADDRTVEGLARSYGVVEFYHKQSLRQYHLCNAVNDVLNYTGNYGQHIA